MERFNLWLSNYGYLSETATDIAVPRWQDRPSIPRQMFTRFYFDAQGAKVAEISSSKNQSWQSKIVQSRLNLKGQVAEIYNRLLAHLRWSILALEKQWLKNGTLAEKGDIFLLKLEEIIALVENSDFLSPAQLRELIQTRKQEWQAAAKLDSVPKLVYGKPEAFAWQAPVLNSADRVQGIGTSTGQIEGIIKIVSSLQQSDREIGSEDRIDRSPNYHCRSLHRCRLVATPSPCWRSDF